MAEPFNYNLQVANPMQGFMSGVQGGLALREIQDQRIAQQQQAEAQARMQQELEDLSKAPTISGIRSFMIRNPGLSDKFKPMLEGMSAEKKQASIQSANNVFLAAKAGKVDVVRSLLQRDIEAAKNSGEDASGAETLLQTLDEDPNKVATQAGLFLSQAMGPEQFEKTYKTLETLPAEVRKGTAEATTAEAKAAQAPQQEAATTEKVQAEAKVASTQAKFAERKTLSEIGLTDLQARNLQSQIDERAARLTLDRDKFATEVQQKVQELYNPAIDGKSMEVMNTAVADSVAADQQGNKAFNLASQIESLGGGWGKLGNAGEWLASTIGKSTARKDLEREYLALRNSAVVASLPKGAASDADIAMALKPFPSEDADAATMASFLRGMGKLQKIKAATEGAKADWIGANGGLRPATRDIVVNGVTVPKGTTFIEFSKTFVERQGAASASQSEVEGASYLKYGKK